MSVNYNGLVYESKSDAIRDMYDNGFVTMESKSKKQLASDLGITVSTVHATILKHMNKSSVHENKKLQKIVVKEISTKGMIAITTAPNVWGLPICHVPLMIDPKKEKRIKIKEVE